MHPVHIGKGEQFDQKFLEISPHGKVPALKEDTANGKTQTIFESGAIMLYLAEKHNQLIGGKKTNKLSVIQWLMFQMANIGPMLGQAHHFRHYANENIQYAINRYTNEASKIYAVLDAQLGKSQYIAGEDYSIADIAIYPWLRPQKMQGQNISHHPNIQRWYNTMRALTVFVAIARMSLSETLPVIRTTPLKLLTVTCAGLNRSSLLFKFTLALVSINWSSTKAPVVLLP